MALRTAPAEACSCAVSELCQQLWDPGAPPPAYFLATVEAIDKRPGGMRLVHLRDVKLVHGATSTTVLTGASEASCGYSFAVGERYFIDAFARPDGAYVASFCSKTRLLAAAKPFINYLESLSRPASGGRVFGDAYSDLPVLSMFDDNDRRPVAKLPLTLSGPVTRHTVTHEDGTFSFDSLPPGTYRLDFTPPTGLRHMVRREEAYDAIDVPNARACAQTWLFFERPRR